MDPYKIAEKMLELIWLKKQGLVSQDELGVALSRLDRLWWQEVNKKEEKEKRS